MDRECFDASDVLAGVDEATVLVLLHYFELSHWFLAAGRREEDPVHCQETYNRMEAEVQKAYSRDLVVEEEKLRPQELGMDM